MTPDPTGRAVCDPEAAAEFLRALAHPMRLQILCRLVEGELPVAGFESELGLKQPSLSQQLAILRNAGLVTTRRSARSIHYSLADGKVRLVLEAMHTAFAAPAQDAGRPGETAAQPAPPARPTPASPTGNGRVVPTASGECGVFSVAGWDLAAKGSGR